MPFQVQYFVFVVRCTVPVSAELLVASVLLPHFSDVEGMITLAFF